MLFDSFDPEKFKMTQNHTLPYSWQSPFDLIMDAIGRASYYGHVTGYPDRILILNPETAAALKEHQRSLLTLGLGFKKILTDASVDAKAGYKFAWNPSPV
jgi:hypothetical protein